MALPRISDAERRRRIAVRHAVAPAHRLDSVEAVTRAMTVLHATEAATVHLAVAARTEGLDVDDVDHALYDARSVVKQLAMRRTLFVFPRDLLPAAWGSASARVATAERKRVAKMVEAGRASPTTAPPGSTRPAPPRSPGSPHGPATTAQLRARCPSWPAPSAATPTSRTTGPCPCPLGADPPRPDRCRVPRSQRRPLAGQQAHLGHAPRSGSARSPEPWDEATGYAELVRRWLATFGPGTAADVQWWLGSTKTAVTRALAEVGAVEVVLDDATTGWVLPHDTADTPPVEPWAALLPTLDPTVMGWKSRDFYLDPVHVQRLFDTNGNAGTTAWWDGRVVGCWVQDDSGAVRLSLLEDVDPAGRDALEQEADRLTRWLDGTVVGTVYSSPQMKQARVSPST